MKKPDPNLLLSIGVLIVSFAALFVSMRQASLLNRQTEILLQQMKSSAWPSVSVGMNLAIRNDTLRSFSIVVNNDGLGPAVIESVKVMIDGRPTTSWSELIEALDPPDGLPEGRTASSLYQQVLSAGEEVVFLDLGNNVELIQLLYQSGDRITIDICYRSIYGEYWVVTRSALTERGTSKSRPVDGCLVREIENFRD